jgi:hypothetical protein
MDKFKAGRFDVGASRRETVSSGNAGLPSASVAGAIPKGSGPIERPARTRRVPHKGARAMTDPGTLSLPASQSLINRLARSAFRNKFKLGPVDRRYVAVRGLDVIAGHADAILTTRVAPATIRNDGRQTPMRGHPVFVAQHAMAICCRRCIAKWHKIPVGHTMTDEERGRLVALLMWWIACQNVTGRIEARDEEPTHQPLLL